MGKMIYLDNAATTKTAPEVVQAMLPYFSEYYGNPSSIYDFAGKSKEAITKGREQIAEVLGAKKEEIYFTAGGSESDNWALKATFEAYKAKGNHIITTKIEHHAILHTCEYLEKRGAKITYVYNPADPSLSHTLLALFLPGQALLIYLLSPQCLSQILFSQLLLLQIAQHFLPHHQFQVQNLR